jgi:hypothetical protein
MNTQIAILGSINQGRKTMALPTNIYEVITVPLQDGSTVELKPASIKLLKAGQKELDKLTDVATNEETLEVLLDVCIVLLKRQRPELADRELAEDLFDLDTVYKVIEVMLGVKLNDPKLIEAALRMQDAQAK